MTTRVLLTALWAIVLIPSANYQLLSGLPLSGAVELVAFLLLVPLTVGRGLRGLLRRATGRWPAAARRAVLAIALLGVAGKVLLLASGSHAGYLACYRSTLRPPAGGAPCERSFENAWMRFAASRIDPVIAFGPRDWDLGFFNSRHFNFYRRPDQRLRARLPFEGSWSGRVERSEPWVARLTYVGEGRIAIAPDHAPADGRVVALPPRYDAPATVLVPVPPGPVALRLEYRFDDGSTVGGPAPAGPWAMLRLERGRGPEGREAGAPVAPVRPAWRWRSVATGVDASGLAVLAGVALFYAGLLRRDWLILALVAVAGPVAYRVDPALVGLPSSVTFAAPLAGLAFTLTRRCWRRRLVTGYFGVAYLAGFTALRSFPRLGVVSYREAGSDPLRYEGLARSILDTWSLEGGEPIFFYQPLFRYIRFLERLVLGDGDGYVLLVALTALHWAVLWSFARLRPPVRVPWPRRAVAGAAVVLLLLLATSAPVVFFVQASLSEYPAWTFLLLLFPMWFGSRSPREWRRGAVLAALSYLTRINHGPALLAQLALLAWRAGRIRPRAMAGVLVIFAAIASLATAHNLYYGGQLVVTIGGLERGALTVIEPGKLGRVLHDRGVRRQVWGQIDHMFYLHGVQDRFPRGEALSRMAIRGLQLLWVATAVVALARRALDGGTRLLLALPLAYLAPHLVFAIVFYYPRHIVAAHLAMGLVTLHVVGRGWRGREGRPPPEPSSRRG